MFGSLTPARCATVHPTGDPRRSPTWPPPGGSTCPSNCTSPRSTSTTTSSRTHSTSLRSRRWNTPSHRRCGSTSASTPKPTRGSESSSSSFATPTQSSPTAATSSDGSPTCWRSTTSRCRSPSSTSPSRAVSPGVSSSPGAPPRRRPGSTRWCPTRCGNQAIIGWMAGTPCRITQTLPITTYEIPTIDRSTGPFVPFHGPAATAKYKRAVESLGFTNRIARVPRYVNGERHFNVLGTRWEPDRPLRIVRAGAEKVTWHSNGLGESTHRWDDVTAEQRRRLVNPDGTTPILFISTTGIPSRTTTRSARPSSRTTSGSPCTALCAPTTCATPSPRTSRSCTSSEIRTCWPPAACLTSPATTSAPPSSPRTRWELAKWRDDERSELDDRVVPLRVVDPAPDRGAALPDPETSPRSTTTERTSSTRPSRPARRWPCHTHAICAHHPRRLA